LQQFNAADLEFRNATAPSTDDMERAIQESRRSYEEEQIKLEIEKRKKKEEEKKEITKI